MKSNYKRIGDYIKVLNNRNYDMKTDTLLGINIDKYFMPSVANVVGTDLSAYKLVQKNQFACNRMHVGRDHKLPIAKSKSDCEFIVSPAYDVFEINDTIVLNPDYLMMWFSRKEFDRNAWYYTDADVRGGLSLSSFHDMKLPIPSIEKQREIVTEYQVIQNRIENNQKLIQKLEETAQAVYKQWFVEFEFPISKEYAEEIELSEVEGKPYKSNGGEMVWCEELGKEIPRGWEVKPFTQIVTLSGGGTPDTNKEKYWNGDIPFFSPADVVDSYYSIYTEKNISELGLKNSSTKLYPMNTVFVTARGTVGAISIAGCQMTMNQSCYAITGRNDMNQYFAHQITLSAIEKLKNEAVGAVFAALVTKNFDSQILIEPEKILIKSFGKKIKPIYDYILNIVKENQKLSELKDLLLSKLATVEG
ncbi:MAG TPA: hypothetical protein DDY71_16460 [Spirochaetia bacterium]|nr:MAG: hypothetical protein A2Y29_08965 [Spirochaetes bacterium GWE2_31_10]HBD94648.1 hypothetical protein [Spirochaetia bacterium]HBI39236.1 hypothetical protein [Spirochaetia bacterium]